MPTAMIWGASGGIGRALTAELAGADWTVLAMARQTDHLFDLTPHVYEADVTDPFAVQQAVMLASQEANAVDLWVYAAGDITSAPVADQSLDSWQQILDANLTGAYHTIHHSLPLLAPDAHIVFLGAVSERLRLPGLAAYASAKAGLEAFADSLRKEQRKRRVTVVRPGAVDTPLWDKVPMKLTANAPAPQKVARRILEAHHNGHKGHLDLT
ncbi:MAG: SDR family NAD(P)-dependent oxidoreductase [Chloroflexi bacterium]|nr:SDR family NAD(P)-dependent oxidoreductase [Chloroflexota bacterium]